MGALLGHAIRSIRNLYPAGFIYPNLLAQINLHF
jgi:hypothetical protein